MKLYNVLPIVNYDCFHTLRWRNLHNSLLSKYTILLEYIIKETTNIFFITRGKKNDKKKNTKNKKLSKVNKEDSPDLCS